MTEREVGRLLVRLRSGQGRQDPYPIYERLRELGPVVPSPLGALLVTDYASCAEIIGSPGWRMPDPGWKDRWVPRWRDYPMVGVVSEALMQLNPPEHGDQRALVMRHLSARTVRDLQPVIDEHAAAAVDRLADRLDEWGTADHAELIADALPLQVLSDLLGDPFYDPATLGKLASDSQLMLEISPGRGELRELEEQTRQLYDHCRAMVEETRRRPRPGLLAALLETVGHDHRHWLAIQAQTMIIAGWKTTSSMLNSMVLALTAHPDQARELTRRPDLVPRAVTEILRWDPPVQILVRVAGPGATLHGSPVPEDQAVHLMVGAAHRDPEEAGDPARFDPNRTSSRRSLAFGLGAHYCLGSRLAQAEAEAVLPLLLRRFGTRLALAAPPVRPRGLAFRDITKLEVTLT
ncbi:cytochrome P450 [Herbidospora cretacea]|uniref:cytochrome P450 n=1 Tax=Herbidospora cretacea TaxID=28444 RepID=UPI0007745873|nr:cytochrome P450 [Herbidospora cretacea]